MLEVEREISKAKTLSTEFYTSERFFAESKEKIFARTWQFVDLKQRVEGLKPFILLDGFVGEPLLLVKQGESINCLSNVCTHRGKILVEESCSLGAIRCRYHGRRFSLDGKMLSMPEFEGVEGFPSLSDDLAQIPLRLWQDLIFVSLDPAFGFNDFITDVQSLVTNLDFDFKSVSQQEYLVKAHWALYCENYLEGFHIPFVHKGLNQVLDFESYTTKLFRFSSLQIGFTDHVESAFKVEIPGITERKKVAALYFFVFPNLMLNFYPWGLSLNLVKPVKPDETKVLYLTLVSDESKRKTGVDLETVEKEDQEIVESVQKGIRSRFFKQGRYSISREQAVHHFHRLIAEFMNR